MARIRSFSNAREPQKAKSLFRAFANSAPSADRYSERRAALLLRDEKAIQHDKITRKAICRQPPRAVSGSAHPRTQATQDAGADRDRGWLRARQHAGDDQVRRLDATDRQDSRAARALECDKAYLARLALEQRGNTWARVLRECFGADVTENESAWLAEIREASGHTDPYLTAKAQKAIRGIFGK